MKSNQFVDKFGFVFEVSNLKKNVKKRIDETGTRLN
jgi:hypothetical protein